MQVMQWTLLIILLAVSPAHALTENEELTALLTNWDPQSLQRVQKMEELSSRTKSDEVALELALILAYAPETHLKVKPHLYADFALKHRKDLNVEDLFSLYRIAGDGFYENLEFKKARAIYQQAIADVKIEAKDREYFVYKNAWAHLNLLEPDQAYLILKKWLLEGGSTLLRNPMMVDLGRSWGEDTFGKNKLASSDLYTPQNESERQQLTEGILKALQRAPSQTEIFYKTFFAQEWSLLNLPTIIESPVIQKKGPCEIMNMKNKMSANLQQDSQLLAPLNSCAITLLKAKKTSSHAYREISQSMQLHTLTPIEQWTVARLEDAAKRPAAACEISLKMIPTMLDVKPEWISHWWEDASSFCDRGLVREDFQTKVLAQTSAWPKLGLKNTLIQSSQLTLATKKTLLQAWESGSPSSTDDDRKIISELMASTDIKEKSKTLNELCPMEKKSCMELWDRQLDVSPQLLIDLIDGSTPVNKDSNSEAIRFVSEFRDYLATSGDAEVKNLNVPPAIVKAPIAQDIAVLQSLESYRRQQVAIPSLEEENAIQALSDFQTQSALGTRHKWSSKSARDKAKREISLVAIYLKNQTSLLGSSKEEKMQWKQIGQAMNKWVVR
jgi:hypothetical protein